jgi:hypothetical protein
MSDDRAPSLDDLVACGVRVANAMGQPQPDASRAAAFFKEILFDEGNRELWACLKAGLITETEIRDATMARFATWLSDSNSVEEPSSDTWSTREIERSFELALLGRPARSTGG